MSNIVIEHSLMWTLGVMLLLWMFVVLRACGLLKSCEESTLNKPTAATMEDYGNRSDSGRHSRIFAQALS
jgi:hypothetical protein